MSADLGDLSAVRGVCGGVPLASLAEAGLLALAPLGVGGVPLPLFPSAAADLRPKNRNLCSDQERNHATYQDLQAKTKNSRVESDRSMLTWACFPALLRLPSPLSVTPNGEWGWRRRKVGREEEAVGASVLVAMVDNSSRAPGSRGGS